ncbi:hypothetical protein [Streptomyces sp. NPDC060366]|uniref:hypothetical protein n=1 Tax=Streptomyces sp. NPDC060366 TaxID=3347105 RepID=UPI00366284F2
MTTLDLPLWAWNLIIAIQSHEEQHSSTHTCLQRVLTAVPEDVRHQAEGISSYIRKANGDALAEKTKKSWDDLVNAFSGSSNQGRAPESPTAEDAWDGHRFGEPGYLDPERCAQCGLDRASWELRQDTRSCGTAQTDAKSGHDFRPTYPDGLACRRCNMPRVEWVARQNAPRCDAAKDAAS